jgi:hypothetical protein
LKQLIAFLGKLWVVPDQSVSGGSTVAGIVIPSGGALFGVFMVFVRLVFMMFARDVLESEDGYELLVGEDVFIYVVVLT